MLEEDLATIVKKYKLKDIEEIYIRTCNNYLLLENK